MSALTAALSVTATSCLDEVYPEDGTMTSDQIAGADKSSLVGAIPAYFNTFTNYNTNQYSVYCSDIGFGGFLIYWDTMTADFPIYDEGYDYFTTYEYTQDMYDTTIQTRFWRRYYYFIRNCNLVLGVTGYDPESYDAEYIGIATACRAWAYMDITRLYEYKHTGVGELDEIATERGLYGVTVPIVTEETTEEESRVAKRAPFYEMYRFIMNDLNLAEVCLKDVHTASAKNYPCIGTVYGMKARMWLEMGSRFERYADDLATQVQAESDETLAGYDKLGITSARECYENAAKYARMAINEGFSPVNESQWYDPVNGFNTPNQAWMFCIIITADAGLAKNVDFQSWPGLLSPETDYGVCTNSYKAYRMIDARLNSKMDANDWRRYTWIQPDDVADETAFNKHYARGTNLNFKEWCEYAAYTGMKWHPGSGNRTTSNTGNVVSIPLMRVEEMYLIEAEALAYTNGAGAGKEKLETFMNSYRMDSGKTYTCADSSLDGVIDAILTQKRIELWSEGLILFDYRRLELPIERGYPGTNHYANSRFNSYPNAVAPWTNICMPERVKQLNPDFPLNPDPSLAISLWKEE